MAAKKSAGSNKRFKFPKFEREAFLAKEVRDAKVSFISLGLAALMAFFSLFIAANLNVGLAILIGFLGPFSLQYLIPAAGIDTSEFERKNWAGPGMITFFAWLGLFILFSNPPFQDLAHPTIDHFDIYQQETDSGNWTRVQSTPGNGYMLPNGSFLVVVRVLDNWELERFELILERNGSGLQKPEMQVLQRDNSYLVSISERDEGHVYYYQFSELEAGNYSVKITALDSRDNSETKQWKVKVNAE